MTYVLLDDNYVDRPAVLELDDATFRLNVETLCYCGRLLTDGLVSGAWMRQRSADPGTDPRVVQLVARGLWEVVDEGWQIVGYLDEQSSRADVDERRRRDRERKHGDKDRIALHRAHDHTQCDRCQVVRAHKKGDHSECYQPWCSNGIPLGIRGDSLAPSPPLHSYSDDPKGGGVEGEGNDDSTSSSAGLGAGLSSAASSAVKGGPDYDPLSDPNADAIDLMALFVVPVIPDDPTDLDEGDVDA